MVLGKGLNFVDARRPARESPVVVRRERLAQRIDDQLAKLRGTEAGQVDGEPSSRGGASRLRWWWTDESGQIFVEIRYARRPLELAKGKFAIKCSSLKDVAAALEAIKAEIAAGSLDTILSKVATEVRSGFKRG